MKWIKANSILILLVALVYGAFVFFHTKSPQVHLQVLGANTNLQLFTQPQSGRQPIMSALESAQQEIDVEVYELSDREVIADLVKEKEKGVQVKVLLEQHPFGAGTINQKSKQTLDQAGILVAWTNPSFPLTHEKAIIVDNVEVFILNQNLTTASFSKNREYDVLDNNPQDVTEVKKIFDADWNRTQFTPTNPHIVESPDTARNNLTTLLQQAATSIDVEMEVLDDSKIVHLLEDKAKTTHVRVILEDTKKISANAATAGQLQQAGIQVVAMQNPYLHAKLLLIDNVKAYIGSVNFTTQSMDENRELGIIISQDDILQNLAADFENDFLQASSPQ